MRVAPLEYPLLKAIHISLAMISVSSLMLRWWWVRTDSPLAAHGLTRSLPHLIDTLFLASGIWLITVIHQYPFSDGWLTAKILGLLVYIVLGSLALKRAKGQRNKLISLIAAVAVFIWIGSVATSKNPFGLFAP